MKKDDFPTTNENLGEKVQTMLKWNDSDFYSHQLLPSRLLQWEFLI